FLWMAPVKWGINSIVYAICRGCEQGKGGHSDHRKHDEIDGKLFRKEEGGEDQEILRPLMGSDQLK
ncbi:MAG: hypothetical protein KDD44_14420, partial [Bdellovibrionales bacterium]|nr:hypothetical protein [Bdellovibrionales bacterium]